MALKTSEKADAPAAPETAVLELALYTQYTWQGVTYEKGKPYRFKLADAIQLMSEQDHGRPIWRKYRPPHIKQKAMEEVVDATMVQAPPSADEFGTLVATKDQKRIEVGDDSEIADILNRDGGGDVTV